MMRLERFEEDKVYMYPDGSIATSDRIKSDFPAVTTFPHVIQTDGCVCFAVTALSTLRHVHNIDESLSDDEAIILIQEIINTPSPEPEPTAEERIAAALEFQNLMNL